ncbi:MAG: CbrC family protein [Myxococcota bacterium]
MCTFDDQGMTFVLFEAPVAEAVTDPPGFCVQCGVRAPLRFGHGFCYACFRAGYADHTINTALGMVRGEDAERGLTHGIPAAREDLEARGWEVVPHPVEPDFPDEQWFSVRVSAADLIELNRTPAYHTWQGEQWQFHCRRPMIYTGSFHGIPDDPEEQAAVEEMIGHPPSPHGSTYSFRCQVCGARAAHHDSD